MTSFPMEIKPIIWLKGLTAEHLEFARELRNTNKEYFFSHRDITPDMQMEWYGSMKGDSRYYRFLIIMKNTAPIGTISIMYPGTSEDPAEIGNVLITESERGNGYGTEAVRLAINNIDACGRQYIHLEVIPGNTKAINFYKKLGFVEYSLTMRMDRK